MWYLVIVEVDFEFYGGLWWVGREGWGDVDFEYVCELFVGVDWGVVIVWVGVSL